jgi:hypothetical protein
MYNPQQHEKGDQQSEAMAALVKQHIEITSDE